MAQATADTIRMTPAILLGIMLSFVMFIFLYVGFCGMMDLGVNDQVRVWRMLSLLCCLYMSHRYDRNTFDQPCSHSIECTTLYVSSGTSTRPTEAGRFWGKSKSKTAECCMHLYCILFFVPVSCIHDYN